MGGGGANSLDSPKTGENSKLENDKEDANLSEDNQEETTWGSPTYKTYDDYFIDLNITKETITEQDFTGKGSLSDPYVVHSTRGFLYLTNNPVSGISLTSKYIELGCDVILNEETFDKDGNVTGGDGVVYNWTNDYLCYKVCIDGKGNSIYGFCGIEFDETITSRFKRSLFVGEGTTNVKNLKLENAYIDGGNSSYVSAIGYSVTSVSNCSVSGYINSANNTFTTSMFISLDEAMNCTNYADIYSTGGTVSGLFSQIVGSRAKTKYIENCNNYGTIYKAENTYVGRVAGVAFCLYSVIAKNCNNYGEIYSEAGQVGGVVSWASGVYLKNCNNYGEITSLGQSGAIVGFVHYEYEYLVLDGCANYGKLNSFYSYHGELVGYVRCLQETVAPVMSVILKNCYIKSINGYSLICNARAKTLQITDCRIDYYDNFEERTVVNAFFYDTNRESNIEIQNCEINCYDKNIARISFGASVYTSTILKVENVLINKSEGMNFVPYNNQSNSFFDYLNGVVVCGGVNCFYGEDFSAFYVDWKSGKIGLKALSGKGFYQGEVSEEILKGKGFVKKYVP